MAHRDSRAVADGATEIDTVLHVGRLKQGDDAYVADDLKAVMAAAGTISQLDGTAGQALLPSRPRISTEVATRIRPRRQPETRRTVGHAMPRAAVHRCLSLRECRHAACSEALTMGGIPSPASMVLMPLRGSSAGRLFLGGIRRADEPDGAVGHLSCRNVCRARAAARANGAGSTNLSRPRRA